MLCDKIFEGDFSYLYPSNIICSVALKVAFCFWENLHYWKQHIFPWIYQDRSTCLSRAFWSHTDLRQAFSGFKNPGSSLRTAAYRESLGHLGPKAETLFQGNLPLPCQRTEHSWIFFCSTARGVTQQIRVHGGAPTHTMSQESLGEADD